MASEEAKRKYKDNLESLKGKQISDREFDVISIRPEVVAELKRIDKLLEQQRKYEKDIRKLQDKGLDYIKKNHLYKGKEAILNKQVSDVQNKIYQANQKLLDINNRMIGVDISRRDITREILKNSDTMRTIYESQKRKLQELNDTNKIFTTELTKQGLLNKGQIGFINKYYDTYRDRQHELTDLLTKDDRTSAEDARIAFLERKMKNAGAFYINMVKSFYTKMDNNASPIVQDLIVTELKLKAVNNNLERLYDTYEENKVKLNKTYNKKIAGTGSPTNKQAFLKERYDKLKQLFDDRNADEAILNAEHKLLKANQQTLAIQVEKYKKERDFIKALDDDLDGHSAVIEALSEEYKSLRLIDTQYKSHDEHLEKVEKRLGSIGGLIGGLKDIGMGRFLDADVLYERLKDAVNIEGTWWERTKRFAPVLVDGLGKSLLARMSWQALVIKGVYELGKFILTSMVAADNRVTQLANSFSVTKDAASDLYDVFEKRVSKMGLAANMQDLIDAQIKFNDHFGVAVVLSESLNRALVLGAKRLKLSDEALQGLAENSLALNQNAEEYTNQILGASYIEQNRSKLYVNNRKILEQVLKTTGGIRMNFKGQNDELSRAITKATQYGTTLDRTQQFMTSLLDFESSIESELKAELITGRQINLERARAYALQGNMTGAMDEMVQQAGGLNEYMKMNVIQQQALAEAFGMSRDDMSDELFRRQMMVQLKEQNISDLEKNTLLADSKFRAEYNETLKRSDLSQAKREQLIGELVKKYTTNLSAEDKFSEAMIKVKEKIAQIFGNGQVLDKLADALIRLLRSFGVLDEGVKTSTEEKAMSLIKGNKLSGSDADMVQQYGERGTTLGRYGNFTKYTSPYGYMAASIKEFFGNKKAEGIINETNVNDAVISPYGKVVISTPKGNLLPHKDDYIVTTPNPDSLFGGNGSDGSMVSMMKELIAKVDQGNRMIVGAVNKNKDVYMDTTKVTGSVKMKSYRV